MKKEKPICSILGDSISSYAGYSTAGYEFYDKYIQQEARMASVKDTWWMQVIHHLGGSLGYNNSISGSTVSGGVSLSGTSRIRQQSLAINGMPDIIILQMGYNDWAYSVFPPEFEDAYRRMLTDLVKSYPFARIYCSTLMRGKEIDDPEMAFFNVDSCVSPMIYSQIIRKCVQDAGLNLVDVEKYGIEYDTIDGVHPNVDGMRTIAQLWIREIESML